MGNNMKNLTKGVSIVYAIYETFAIFRKMSRGEFNSFDSIMNFFLPILFVALLLCGFYGFGCLLESLDDIKDGMILMMNYERKTKENKTLVYPMYSQDSTCQNSVFQNPAYQTQNYQENGLANIKPLDTGWECSCGCENEANSRFCINCGQKRV